MPEATRCPNCGASTESTDAFCPECGHRLAQSIGDETASYGSQSSSQSGPPPYSPPPNFGPTMPPPPGAPPSRGKGFFADLFDFCFTDFVTPKVIKFVYVVVTIIIALAWVFYLVLGFSISATVGLLVLIFGPVVGLFFLLLWRMALELTMVIFQIGADLHAVKERRDLD
ncbi:DUF4282 domain-containing protein [Streptomyces sp. NBC_01622]|uniref:DUF4282 domain-containing protein n=1 Tax=Streptomyces sp. NBC_01622 TaxID=2975903 RepID=UPI003867AAE0|nr:DUF4282 domain-containing protein [Streptomyces sp. NBC_01622]